MTFIQALFLGVLQGVTEFLPVSSSGHLVLAEQLLDLKVLPKDLLVLNILLHAGTLAALLIAYAPVWINLLAAPLRRDTDNVRRLALLIIATIPGAVAGLLFEDWIAQHFQSMFYVGAAFAVTGVVLLLGECCPQKKQSLLHRLMHPMKQEPHKLTTRSAFFIGITQALALVPGLSRSGLTISAGRSMGLERKDALDFSFLMATPIIAGATVVSGLNLLEGNVVLPTFHVVFTAVAVSFVTSLISIMFLRKFVVSRSLGWFAPYLFVASALTMFLHFS